MQHGLHLNLNLIAEGAGQLCRRPFRHLHADIPRHIFWGQTVIDHGQRQLCLSTVQRSRAIAPTGKRAVEQGWRVHGLVNDDPATRHWRQVRLGQPPVIAGTVAQHADRKVWEIQLDGRTLKTSAQRDLHLPTRSLAQAIAYEWNAQDTKIVPNSMPVTQLVFTGIDNFGDDIDAIRDETAKYGETDLLCYRVSEPNALAALQDEGWQPLLDWAAKQLDAPLTVTRGIMAVEQPAQSLFALRRPLDRLDILHITALRTLVGATGSLVLALAVYYGRLSPDETVELATLEERFQIETWGPDEDLESSLEGKREDARSAGTILAALSRLD